jgi:hypothetical protein
VLLIDNSAWARRGQPDVRARVADLLEANEVAVCLPFLLEAGYSARSADEHDQIVTDLARLQHVAIDAEVETLALEAQRRLARRGHHRLPPSDLIIAACAHRSGAGILHYDRDYDLIAEHTDLSFESVWLAPAGSL